MAELHPVIRHIQAFNEKEAARSLDPRRKVKDVPLLIDGMPTPDGKALHLWVPKGHMTEFATMLGTHKIKPLDVQAPKELERDSHARVTFTLPATGKTKSVLDDFKSYQLAHGKMRHARGEHGGTGFRLDESASEGEEGESSDASGN